MGLWRGLSWLEAGPHFQGTTLETTGLSVSVTSVPGKTLEKILLESMENLWWTAQNGSQPARLQEREVLPGHPDFLLQQHNPPG